MLKRHIWLVLIVLLGLHVLAHIDRSLLLGFSPQITRDFGLSNTQFGLLVGAVWVVSFGLMAVVLGALADRFSRTRIIAGGLLVWSIFTLATSVVTDFTQMTLVRICVAAGEAALVPAATSLLVDLFDEKRRATANGIFFMGVPIGVGLAFVIAGTLGAKVGWQNTFALLGGIGIVVALPLLLVKEERSATVQAKAAPLLTQLAITARVFRDSPRVLHTTVGFVVIHILFAGFSFYQLWLVRERGLPAEGIAQTIGLMQIVFGTLGAVIGGVLGDKLGERIRGGRATVLIGLVLVCAPLIIAHLYVSPASALFYTGMAASIFLPMATYGSALAIIQSESPAETRSTLAGVTMLCISILTVALANFVAGLVADLLTQSGAAAPLTLTLLGLYACAFLSVVFFILTARLPVPSLVHQ